MGQIKNIKLHIVTDIKNIMSTTEDTTQQTKNTTTNTTELPTQPTKPSADPVENETTTTRINDTKDDAPSSAYDGASVDADKKDCGSMLVNEDGSLNWDIPCFGHFRDTPCWDVFKETFSCIHFSKNEPPSECFDKYDAFMTCLEKNPEHFPLPPYDEDGGGADANSGTAGVE